MKIIAGQFRGRVIKSLEESNIRPTRSVVREAVFSSITSGLFPSKIEDALVMDICCGSGSYGIEALSRGANKVIFLDKNRKHLTLTKQNLANLGIEERQHIFMAMDARFLPKAERPVDIIFIDPPYNFNMTTHILAEICKKKWCHSSSLIVAETALQEDFTPPEELEIISIKKYGITKIQYIVPRGTIEEE